MAFTSPRRGGYVIYVSYFKNDLRKFQKEGNTKIDKAFLIAEPMIKAYWTKCFAAGGGGVFGWGLRSVAVEDGWDDWRGKLKGGFGSEARSVPKAASSVAGRRGASVVTFEF